MNILSKLFSKKTNKQQPKEVVRVDPEINHPAQITKPLSEYVKEIPEWIGQHIQQRRRTHYGLRRL